MANLHLKSAMSFELFIALIVMPLFISDLWLLPSPLC